jgi:putative ABC transport system permease protein
VSLWRSIQMAWRALSHNKGRAFLTMLGVIIGVGSVIMMLAIGAGTQASVTSSITSLGSNLLMVSPQRIREGNVVTGSQSASLTSEDALALGQISGVAAAVPVSGRNCQLIAGANNTNTQVIGTTVDYPAALNAPVAQGSFFSQNDVDRWRKVAVLGTTVATTLFPRGNPLGQTVQVVNGSTIAFFQVIGVLASKGGSGFNNQDDQVLIPLTTAQQLVFGSKTLSGIDLQVATSDQMTQVSSEATSILRIRHKIATGKSDDFSILNQEQLLGTLTSVLGIFTILLAGIAGISLLVGGIGIMNIMLVSVTERTREIGLRKAIGARSATIVTQFLVEAMMLALLGGAIGILLGYAGGALISTFTGLATLVTPTSVLLGFFFSLIVGVFFGFYPARRAASLNPIDALRYE